MGQARIKNLKALLTKISNEPLSPAAEALRKIRQRPVAERNVLGKMIKCGVCGLRHRETKVCKQVFVKRGEEELIAGETVETEAVVVSQRNIVGAAPFKGKRKHPHLSKRKLQFTELVRSFTPDEYTVEDLLKAKRRANRIMRRRESSWKNL